jgi:hypothetical protein
MSAYLLSLSAPTPTTDLSTRIGFDVRSRKARYQRASHKSRSRNTYPPHAVAKAHVRCCAYFRTSDPQALRHGEYTTTRDQERHVIDVHLKMADESRPQTCSLVRYSLDLQGDRPGVDYYEEMRGAAHELSDVRSAAGSRPREEATDQGNQREQHTPSAVVHVLAPKGRESVSFRVLCLPVNLARKSAVKSRSIGELRQRRVSDVYVLSAEGIWVDKVPLHLNSDGERCCETTIQGKRIGYAIAEIAVRFVERPDAAEHNPTIDPFCSRAPRQANLRL